MSKDTNLADIKAVHGYTEWRAHPVTAALLAKLDAKVAANASELVLVSKLTQADGKAREREAFLAGSTMTLNSVAAAVDGKARAGLGQEGTRQ